MPNKLDETQLIWLICMGNTGDNNARIEYRLQVIDAQIRCDYTRLHYLSDLASEITELTKYIPENELRELLLSKGVK